MRVFVTSKTSDREEEPEITLYEIDAGRLIDMLTGRMAELQRENQTDPFLFTLVFECISVVS